jgi:hypothetical protein
MNSDDTPQEFLKLSPDMVDELDEIVAESGGKLTRESAIREAIVWWLALPDDLKRQSIKEYLPSHRESDPGQSFPRSDQ